MKPREFEEALSSWAYVLESPAPDGLPAILVGEETTSKEILWPPAPFIPALVYLFLLVIVSSIQN